MNFILGVIKGGINHPIGMKEKKTRSWKDVHLNFPLYAVNDTDKE
jgi:hypothetical protein